MLKCQAVFYMSRWLSGFLWGCFSPVGFVSKVHTPFLLLHGKLSSFHKNYGVKSSLKIKCRNNRKAHMKHCEVPKLWNNFVIYNYWYMVAACLVVYQTIWWPHLYTKIEDINFPQTRGKYTIQICSIFTYAFFPESLGHSDPSCHFDIDKKTPTVCIVEVYKQQEVL